MNGLSVEGFRWACIVRPQGLDAIASCNVPAVLIEGARVTSVGKELCGFSGFEGPVR